MGSNQSFEISVNDYIELNGCQISSKPINLE
jgi:hypothetical protein